MYHHFCSSFQWWLFFVLNYCPSYCFGYLAKLTIYVCSFPYLNVFPISVSVLSLKLFFLSYIQLVQFFAASNRVIPHECKWYNETLNVKRGWAKKFFFQNEKSKFVAVECLVAWRFKAWHMLSHSGLIFKKLKMYWNDILKALTRVCVFIVSTVCFFISLDEWLS